MTSVNKVQAVVSGAAEIDSEPGNSAAAVSHPVLVAASRPAQPKLYEVGALQGPAGLAPPRGRQGVSGASADSELSQKLRALAAYRYEAHRLQSEIAALEAIRDRTGADPELSHQSQLAMADDISIQLNWRYTELRGALALAGEAQTEVQRLRAQASKAKAT